MARTSQTAWHLEAAVVTENTNHRPKTPPPTRKATCKRYRLQKKTVPSCMYQ